MHALKRIHRSLRPDGVLLDLHPQPEQAGVEVWHGDRFDRLGFVDQEEDIREILAARASLDLVEGDGWYATERRRVFDLLHHSPSAENWLEHQAREGFTGAISEELLASARELLAGGGGEFIVREPIRATVLRRSPRIER